MAARMHADQYPIDVDLVQRLVAQQFPEWAGLPVVPVSGGATVNAIFRLGPGLAARLPLRIEGAARSAAHSAAELEREAAALDELADAIAFSAPRSVAIGHPGLGYPSAWAVHTWIPGSTPTPTSLSGSDAFADDLVALITALRSAPLRGRTFAGTGRGGALPDHDEWMSTCFRESEGLLDVPALRRRWDIYRRLPATRPEVMAHRDLHPGNLLVRDERLSGVLDGGGFGPADPALDLVVAWHMLDARRRERMRIALGCDDVEWARGAAWAFQQSMGLVWYYRTSNPIMSALGRSTLERIMSEAVPVVR